MFRSRTFILLTHSIGWLLFISLPLLFLSHNDGSGQLVSILSSPLFWLFCGCYISLFYFHTYWLIPRLFLNRRYYAYTAIVMVLFVGIFFLKPFDLLVNRVGRKGPPPRYAAPPPGADPGWRMPPPPPGEGNVPPNGRPVRLDITSIFLFIMILALSLAEVSTRSLRMSEQRAMKAEADRANAQLSFLTAQINPHFLFNTLNNIYSLAITNDEHTATAIMKLSNIMRYVTDEVGVEYGSLENEAACIQDYIDLHRLRLGRKVQLQVTIEGELENRRIAPLILMTFIENVFKHGVSNHYDSPITIRLAAEADKIIFYCRNRIFQKKENIERRGIGISNTLERLEHLYPSKYQLDINTEDEYYTVSLVLFV